MHTRTTPVRGASEVHDALNRARQCSPVIALILPVPIMVLVDPSRDHAPPGGTCRKSQRVIFHFKL